MLQSARIEGHIQQSALANGGRVRLKVLSGKDLVIRDKNMFSKGGSSDAYVKVLCGGTRTIGSTSVVKKSTSPEWNSSFEFDFLLKESPVVVLAIFDKDKIGSDDPMGIVSIKLSDLGTGLALDANLPVEQCSGAEEPDLGTLSIQASFDPKIPVALSAGVTAALEHEQFILGLGWDPVASKKAAGGRGGHSQQGASQGKVVDLDAAAVVFNKRGRMLEGIYFDNVLSTKATGEGAICHQGDSQTGEEVLGGDDELIHFDVKRLAPEVLCVYVCISCFTDGSSFNDVAGAHCRIFNPATGSEDSRLALGKLGPRTAVTVLRIQRDASSPTGWSVLAMAAVDSVARSWGFLVPNMMDWLGQDLVPGLKGSRTDRIAILSKGQSFKIADVCDTIPDRFCVGLHWDVTEGKNIDLDAAIAMFDKNFKPIDIVAFNKVTSNDRAIRHCGDEREGDEVGDDEKILIELEKVSGWVDYICVVICSFSGQELDDVKDAGCHIFDARTSRDACKLSLTGEKTMDGHTSCHVCTLFRAGNDWWCKSASQGMGGRQVAEMFPALTASLKEERLVARLQEEQARQCEAEKAFAAGVASGLVAGAAAAAAAVSVEAAGNELGLPSPDFGTPDIPNIPDGILDNANASAQAAVDEIDDAGNIVHSQAQVTIQAGRGVDVSAAIYAIPTPSAVALPNYSAEEAAAAAQAIVGDMDLTLALDVGLGAIKNLSGLVQSIPILGALCPVMNSVVDGARTARYNKLAAKGLADRIQELALALFDLLKAVPEPSPSLELELQRLVPLLEECSAFMVQFQKRSYLGRVLTGFSDGEKLRVLDKAITDVVQNISLSLGATQVQMAQQQFDKLDQLADLVKRSVPTTNGGGGGQELSEDSPVVGAIARCVGVEVREVMGQLQFSVDKILENQSDITAKLDAALARVAGGDDSDIGGKYPPEDPKVFWSEYFGSEKMVPIEHFVPVFEEEFTPGEVDELSSDENKAMVHVLDAYPCDGVVSIVEWKRFCKAATQSGKTLYGFVKLLTAKEAEKKA